MTSDPQYTPLFNAHVALGARMIDFSGWMMPVQYEGIVAEHNRTRTSASMFDTCHMGRFHITGTGADAALSGILTTNLLPMRDGQCRYGFLLRPDGGILDDLIAYRFAADRWMLVVNAGTQDQDAAWIRDHLPAGVTFDNVSSQTGKIDVQGPQALHIASRVLSLELSAIRYFHFTQHPWQGAPLVVSRTGYTGEPGVEIYGSVRQIQQLWQTFLDAGVRPAGLGARDTLRLEAALPLYGHELTESVTPAEAGMERYASKPEPFIGKDALVERLASGPSRRLAGFRAEGRQSARSGNRILKESTPVGEVTSGSFSPSLQCAIGLAYVDRRHAAIGESMSVDTGRNRLDVRLVNTPFYSPQRREK